jgi:hypothetical protein
MRDAGRDHDPVVGGKLARLDRGPLARPVHQGPDVDERDERPARRDDPVVELTAVVVQAAEHTRR